MEGKGVRTMIMGILILGLLVAQIEADPRLTICCIDNTGADCYHNCMNRYTLQPPDYMYCSVGCKCLYDQTSCPPTHPIPITPDNPDATINEYCKLGCVSSVCDTITTNSDIREGQKNEAVEDYCVNACSELCNKGAKTALASA